MKKVPFVTKEQLDEIVKKYPTTVSICMMKSQLAKM